MLEPNTVHLSHPPKEDRHAQDTQAATAGPQNRGQVPGLSDQGRLDLLGRKLGIPLELVGTEVPVGDFSLDIPAPDANSGALVAIENHTAAPTTPTWASS